MPTLLTFVIPVYNRVDLLERTLNSLVSQTNLNFEVIVVDDGSLDNPFPLCRTFSRLLRLRYFSISNSGSPSFPRNLGLLHTRTPWVCFLDSDDIATSSCVDVFSSVVTSYPNLSLFHTAVYETRDGSVCSSNSNHYNHFCFSEVLFRGNKISLSSCFIRTSILPKACFSPRTLGGTTLLRWEDYHLWLELSRSCPNYMFISKPLFYINKDDTYSNRSVRLRKGLIHFRFESRLNRSQLPPWYFRSLSKQLYLRRHFTLSFFAFYLYILRLIKSLLL